MVKVEKVQLPTSNTERSDKSRVKQHPRKGPLRERERERLHDALLVFLPFFVHFGDWGLSRIDDSKPW